MEFELGEKVKDTLTGFAGVITGRAEYSFDTNSYLVVSPTLEEGKPVEKWIAAGRLVKE